MSNDLHIINPYALTVKSFNDIGGQAVIDHLKKIAKININIRAVVVVRSDDVFLLNTLKKNNIFVEQHSQNKKNVECHYVYTDKKDFDINFYMPLRTRDWVKDTKDTLSPNQQKAHL